MYYEEKIYKVLNEAAKGLQGYQKYVEKKKGELLFYAESPDGTVFMGLEKTKNGKFDLGVGTPYPSSGAQISAIEAGDEYSSLSQAMGGIKSQISLAKQGNAHPDEKKFNWKVVVNKLKESNESVNEGPAELKSIEKVMMALMDMGRKLKDNNQRKKLGVALSAVSDLRDMLK